MYEYNGERKLATDITAKLNQAEEEQWNEKQKREEQLDVEDARRHIILEYGTEKYKSFGTRPDSVNPYLWQSRVNSEFAGVYQLADHHYAVTGASVCLIGLIKGETGWIAIDTGASEEEGNLSIELVEKATGESIKGNIHTLIITHTHYDHFAGAKAFITEGKTVVIGPKDYEQSLVDDNLYAGTAMSRRLIYQSGMALATDELGAQGCGVQALYFFGKTSSTVIPNQLITEEETRVIDGVELSFVLTPNTETRAHMVVYDHTNRVLALGDNSMGTLHNTYTPRGAKTRDAAFWGEVFYHLYLRFGEEVQAVYQGHGIPHFKRTDHHLQKYLLDNAVAYKFTNDQALLLANQGVKLQDIGRKIHIPDSIKKTWYTRDHYGNYTFNARGSVNLVMGFYDGNPVNLWPLEEVEYARKIVEYIGSEDKILEKAEEDFNKGEYQWVANITHFIVMKNPNNTKARYLCADALEQLGYQTQTGLWRNMYLTGAKELRNPESRHTSRRLMDNSSVIPFATTELLLEYLGIHFDGEKGQELSEKFLLHVAEEAESRYVIEIYKGTVFYDRYVERAESKEKLPELILTKHQIYELGSKRLKLNLIKGELTKEAAGILTRLQEAMVDTDVYSDFNIIEPLEENN